MTHVHDGDLLCPLRAFHCCPDGVEGGRGFARMISHLKRLHLCNDERKRVIRETLSKDHEVFLALDETLKVLRRWMCGSCMSLQALSRACHHSDGLVRAGDGAGAVESHIVGILKPSLTGPEPNVASDGVVFDGELLDKVFKVPITTVKSIPYGCRLVFSQALKAALHKVATESGSVASWVKLLLLPRCTLQVFKPKNRRDSRSGSRKLIQQHRIRSALATWGEADGISKLVVSVLSSPESGVAHSGRDFHEEEDKKGNTNVRQCLRKVVDGYFTAAVKVLGSSGVAPYNGNTVRALAAKHPFKSPPSKPVTTFSDAPLVAESDTVLECIKSFPKGTSCGRDGLRAQHFLDALCGEGSVVATDL